MSAPSVSRQVPTYYSSVRSEILPLIEHYRELTTLDVGCGEGLSSAMLRERGIAKTKLGIEYSPQAAAKASVNIDQLKIGDVESMDLSDWNRVLTWFFAWMCSNICAIHGQQSKGLLLACGPTGHIVASIPNVQNHHVVLPLLRGQWNYEEAGLKDRTHLRFFTHRTARQLIESGGFTIESELFTMGPKSKLLNTLSFCTLRGFLVGQYLIRGRIQDTAPFVEQKKQGGSGKFMNSRRSFPNGRMGLHIALNWNGLRETVECLGIRATARLSEP